MYRYTQLYKYVWYISAQWNTQPCVPEWPKVQSPTPIQQGCCVLKFPIWAKTFPRKTRNKQFSLQFFTVQTRHDLFEPGCRTFQVWWTQQTQRTEQTSWNCGAILVSVWQCLVSTGEAILDLAITWRVHTSTTEHWTCAFDVLTRASMC